MEWLHEYVSVGQAAKSLNVSPDRVRQLLRAGRLPCHRTSLGALIPKAAVEQLAREREERRSRRETKL